jgi:hypothetical protein
VSEWLGGGNGKGKGKGRVALVAIKDRTHGARRALVVVLRWRAIRRGELVVAGG